MSGRLAIVLSICVVAAAAARQQSASGSQSDQPTFRAGANYVRVDMYPTRNGQPIEDLRQDEIELFEDGKPQRIEAFEHVHIRPAAPTDVRVDPESLTRSREQAADPRARVFVVFLDTYHTQIDGSARMREPLVRFIDSVLGPDDLIGVMTPEMSAADLTLARKTTVMSRMISDNTFWGRRDRGIVDNDPKEDVYDACYPPNSQKYGQPDNPIATAMKARRREKLSLDALEDLSAHLNGIREERKAVLVVTEGWLLFTPDRRLMDAQGDQPPPVAIPPGDRFGRRPSDTGASTGRSQAGMQAECDADRIALASMDDQDRLLRIGNDANRSNVSFYTVYARGLVPFDAPIGPAAPPPPRQDAANLSSRQNGLKLLADATDGTWVITNEIEKAMSRIVADLSSYYLLGYYSTNTKLDGGFRSITVRVKRPGVQVRARKGYRSLTADAVRKAATKTATAVTPDSPVAKAFNTVAAADARAPLRLRTASWRADSDRTSSMWIVGEIDADARRQMISARLAKADVTVFAPDGRRVTNATNVDMADGSFAVRVSDDAGLAPGEYSIRVRVAADADRSGPLTDSLRAVLPDASSILGEPVLWRRGLATGPRFVATADPRFSRTDRVRLELPTRSVGTATARLLDRQGAPLPVPLSVSDRSEASDGLRWIVVDGTLAPLAAGDYAIEVTLAGTTRVTAIRVKTQ
jgi:VWFA-related protein